MHDEWNRDVSGTDAGNRGYPASNADTLRAMIRLYHDAGMHVSRTPWGTGRSTGVVESYAQAMAVNPTKGLRHGIIHANVPTDRAMDTMARLQREFDAGYPEPSATFTWWIGDTYAGNFGAARAQRLNPFAAYRARGMTWANGSDFQVTPFPARYGVWSAVAREPLLGVYGGDPFGRKESGGRAHRASQRDDLGGPADVPRDAGGVDRGGEAGRPGGVGPGFLCRAYRGDQGGAVCYDGI